MIGAESKRRKKEPKLSTKDIGWDHGKRVNEEERMKVQCNYCNKIIWGGVFRLKHHLAGSRKDTESCLSCPDEVRDLFTKWAGESGKKKTLDSYYGDDESEAQLEINRSSCANMPVQTNTINTLIKKKERRDVVADICRAFYANSISFNVMKDPFMRRVFTSCAEFGKGLIPPSFHEVKVSHLKQEVERIDMEFMPKYREEWKRTGCTLMSDGWTDSNTNRSITNFLVNSPRGTVFIKSVDTSGIIHDAEALYGLLNSMVDEIGEENVIQVITDSASAYVSAGDLLARRRSKLFWNPCSSHLYDLMLKDIGELPRHKATVAKAREITVYIYRHAWVLELLRKYTKKKELVRVCVTRFATNYLTLKRLLECMVDLRAMFDSVQWQTSSSAKKAAGIKVRDIICADRTFWPSVRYCLMCVLPLVRVLRLVDGELKPPMGYMYEATDKAKGQIIRNLKGIESLTQPVLNIVDVRWNKQLRRSLHGAGHFLNPKHQYDPKFRPNADMMLGLYEVITKFTSSDSEREIIDRQMESFKRAEGLFGIPMAVKTRESKQPALWWESFGASCPELQDLAFRVLSPHL